MLIENFDTFLKKFVSNQFVFLTTKHLPMIPYHKKSCEEREGGPASLPKTAIWAEGERVTLNLIREDEETYSSLQIHS